MDDLKIFKEKQINNYIHDNISLVHATTRDIMQGLKNLLGEEPAVKFNYRENMKLNEKTGILERLSNELESVEIYYTYIGSDNMQHASHMTYVVN